MTVITSKVNEEDVGLYAHANLRNGSVQVSGMEWTIVHNVRIRVLTSKGVTASGSMTVPQYVIDELVLKYLDARLGGSGHGVQLKNAIAEYLAGYDYASSEHESYFGPGMREAELIAGGLLSYILGGNDE